MAAAFEISEAINPKDGVNASLTLSGTPSGVLTFLAARTPDVDAAAEVTVTSSEGNAYLVAVAHPALWYFWGHDDNGHTTPKAVWVGLSDDVDLNLCGLALRDILIANLDAINAGMQSYLPGSTVKCVVYGSPTGITDWPAILIARPKERTEYVAAPYVRDHTFLMELFMFLVHEDEGTGLDQAVQFAQTCMAILNQPAYEQIRLESGLSIAFCNCSEGDADEQQVVGKDSVWAATGTLVWSAKALKQDSL